MYSHRIAKISKVCIEKNIQYLFIQGASDLFYVTGCCEEEAYGILDVQKKEVFILCDPRLTLHIKESSQYGEVIEFQDNFDDLIQDIIGDEVLFLSEDLYLSLYKRMEKIVTIDSNSLSPIQKARVVKDSYEIDCIEKACSLADDVLDHIVEKHIYEGVDEKEVAWEIEKAFRERGASALSFPSIVAFGANGACPHHHSGDTKLKKNTPILIDMGCVLNHYCSDITRMFWFGDAIDEDFQKDYESVLEAQEKACENFKKGISVKDLDSQCRENLKKYKLDIYFTHSLGHSVGIDVHDGESISSKSDYVLEDGFVGTIEPGVYKEGKYGIRIEDTVVCNEECLILTKSSKELKMI